MHNNNWGLLMGLRIELTSQIMELCTRAATQRGMRCTALPHASPQHPRRQAVTHNPLMTCLQAAHLVAEVTTQRRMRCTALPHASPPHPRQQAASENPLFRCLQAAHLVAEVTTQRGMRCTALPQASPRHPHQQAVTHNPLIIPTTPKTASSHIQSTDDMFAGCASGGRGNHTTANAM